MKTSKLILLFSFALNSLILNGQMVDDYIVQTSGDTLRGKVTLLRPESNNEAVTVRLNKNQLQFNSNRLTRVYVDSAFYSSIRNGNKYQIMKEITAGYLGLYEFRYEDNADFEVKYLYKSTGEGLQIPSLTFKNTVSKFINECPLVADKVKNGEYSRKHLEQVVEEYNKFCLNREYNFENTKDLGLNTNSEKIIAWIDELKKEDQLLNDLKTKLSTSQPIPSYMIEALKNKKESNDWKKIEKIINLLESEK